MGCTLIPAGKYKRSRPINLLIGMGIICVVIAPKLYTAIFSENQNSIKTFSDAQTFLEDSRINRRILNFVENNRRFPRQISAIQNVSSNTTNTYTEEYQTTDASDAKAESKGEYPPDIFDLEARRKGAVVLHVIGMLYMFTALAIVCDEFFVPALEVIIRKFEISDDVAGATFMAAGGSAPELFTSFIGTFIAHSNVGIGTIVGSAVFNILFVIGMCALVSKEILKLTWWPLFRDCAFYIISLLVIILSFRNEEIEWYESLIMISTYLAYVTFMKYNKSIEKFVKKHLKTNPIMERCRGGNSTSSKISPIKDGDGHDSAVEDDHRHKHHTTFSYGIVQLMMHSLDPVSEAKTTSKPATLYAMARLKAKSPTVAKNIAVPKKRPFTTNQVTRPTAANDEETEKSGRANYRHSVGATPTTVVYEKEGFRVIPIESSSTNSLAFGVVPNKTLDQGDEEGIFDDASQIPRASSISNPSQAFGENGSFPSSVKSVTGLRHIDSVNDPAKFVENNRDNGIHRVSIPTTEKKLNGNFSEERILTPTKVDADVTSDFNDLNNKDKPQSQKTTRDHISCSSDDSDFEDALDMSWPSTCGKRIVYLLLAPIMVPLWLVVPDVRRPEKQKYYPITFLCSIVSIALYSYLMVWWAHQIGETVGLSEEEMGLTFLAAGTSVPDLITSVIVARKGMGDMAVSSSVGSNIFDVTIGLPLPWLLSSIFRSGASVVVTSSGLFCSILMLFLMLIFVVITIAVCGWKMSKALGFTMLGLYGVFLVISLLLQSDILTCPSWS